MAFVQAIATHRAGSVARLVEPGSPASRYITHQKALVEAQITVGGFQLSDIPAVPDQKNQTITVSDPASKPVTFSDFQFTPDGLLQDFRIQGRPIEPRLWTQPAHFSAGGTSFRLVSAFERGGDRHGCSGSGGRL